MNDPTLTAGRRAAILLAKASITGAASREMETLARGVLGGSRFHTVLHAFSEQGSPSLREVLNSLGEAAAPFDEICILPCLLPMEPGFKTWITGAVQRWAQHMAAAGRTLPRITVTEGPSQAAAMLGVLQAVCDGPTTEVAPAKAGAPALGSVIPPQKRRVLVCQGGPCNDAGAALVWGHLRNEQKRLDLRTTGDGMMSARTSCLGPCKLAPVVQVFPEGTWYGGVDEAGMDRIVAEHLLQGQPVEALAYAPSPDKQVLR
ncbi:(2Fe-2S) ferredoxin domain-containing protein [Hydrogenophaga palleronii]|uniref:(2Fe-2S) ferredoxin domain-containing protein n=1 Tax=Hydrogenophaga palleronii TaxID=65655 RepID=UPI000824D3FA|nr:(2Fe-2S) ferredoxin domain-containing protein [Hydrogenophaga palleronii]